MSTPEPSARLIELRDSVVYLEAELRSIHDTADGRPLEADEQTRFDDGLWLRHASIAEGIDIEARAVALASFNAGAFESSDGSRAAPSFHRDIDPYDARYQAEVGYTEAARRAVGDHAEYTDAAKEEVNAKLSRSGSPAMRGIDRLVLAHSSEAYARGFFKIIGGRDVSLTDEERQALAHAQDECRAMSLTDGAGGFLVPTFLDPSVIATNAGTRNPFRQISSVVSVTGDNWNGITSAGITASWDAEGIEVSDDAPAFQSPQITPHKAAAFVPISIEAFEDIAGASGEITAMFSDAKDRLESTAHATGSGSNEPYGVVTRLASLAVGAVYTSMTTNNSFVAADLFKAQETLGERFEAGASWVMNKAWLNRVRALGTSDNFFARSVDLPSAAPERLLGDPVYKSSALTSARSTTTNNAIVYGDFEGYKIVDRIGMSVEVIPHLFHASTNRPSGQRGLYTHWRTGADVVNNTAFVLLFNPNTALVV